jgi:cell division protein FtsN
VYWKLNHKAALPLASTSDVTIEMVGKTKTVEAKKDGNRFDFYTLLPGSTDQQEGRDLSVAQVANAKDPAILNLDDLPASASVAPAIAPITTTPAPKSKDLINYIVQAGSFRGLAQAEKLRSQLALSGFEARIQTFKVGSKETWYRVYLGPFSSRDAAIQRQAQLERAQRAPSVMLTTRSA